MTSPLRRKMADVIKIRINELFLRVEAATLAKQYNIVEELLLQAENILETAGTCIALDADAQVSLSNITNSIINITNSIINITNSFSNITNSCNY